MMASAVSTFASGRRARPWTPVSGMKSAMSKLRPYRRMFETSPPMSERKAGVGVGPDGMIAGARRSGVAGAAGKRF